MIPVEGSHEEIQRVIQTPLGATRLKKHDQQNKTSMQVFNSFKACSGKLR